jgi:hypothetical protein
MLARDGPRSFSCYCPQSAFFPMRTRSLMSPRDETRVSDGARVELVPGRRACAGARRAREAAGTLATTRRSIAPPLAGRRACCSRRPGSRCSKRVASRCRCQRLCSRRPSQRCLRYRSRLRYQRSRFGPHSRSRSRELPQLRCLRDWQAQLRRLLHRRALQGCPRQPEMLSRRLRTGGSPRHTSDRPRTAPQRHCTRRWCRSRFLPGAFGDVQDTLLVEYVTAVDAAVADLGIASAVPYFD